MRVSVFVACLVAALGACGGTAPTDIGSGTGSSPDASASNSPTPSSSPGEPAATLSTKPGDPSDDLSPSASPRVFVTIGSVDDRRGDAGREARAYNDLVGVRVQDDGSRARVLVRLGTDVPTSMPDGEQMGIGVDFYRSATAEDSDYQIFAAGTSEGWQAFFETPDGFVEYPGSFGIGDDILQFVIPWSSFRDMRAGRFAVFLDWDREALAVGLAGQDRAPDADGRARFAR